MEALRSNIIREAKTWIGTPFLEMGRTKHGGCDCIGLVIGVFRSLKRQGYYNRLSTFDLSYYDNSPKYMEYLLNVFNKYLQSSKTLLPGNIILYTSSYAHLGIIGHEKHYTTLIHSCMKRGKVIEHRLTPSMLSRKKYQLFTY